MRKNRGVLVCVECGRVSDGEAVGWRAYREDVPDEPQTHKEEINDEPSG